MEVGEKTNINSSSSLFLNSSSLPRMAIKIPREEPHLCTRPGRRTLQTLLPIPTTTMQSNIIVPTLLIRKLKLKVFSFVCLF